MKNVAIKILVFSILVMLAHPSFSQDEKPKNIDEAVNYFIKKWSDKTKKEFTDTSKGRSPVGMAHFGVGMWIRNNWIRGDRDTGLVDQFHKLGIFVPDDMSGIILELLFMRLTHRSENLDSMVADVLEQNKKWEEYRARSDSAARAHLRENADNFKIGDSVRVYIRLDSFIDGRPTELGRGKMFYQKIARTKEHLVLIIDGKITGKNDAYRKFWDANISVKIYYVSRQDIHMPDTYDFTEGVKSVKGRLIEVGNTETFDSVSMEMEKY